MGCLGDFSWWLRSSRRLTRNPTIMSQYWRRIRRIRAWMISLEPQHILAGTTQPSLTTCRRRKGTKIRPKKLRFQQPCIRLIASFFNRRSFLYESKSL
jgi:hypothetical protein